MPVTNSTQGKTWRLNTPNVSSELIGGEVVAIHLPTGMYYSIENTGAVIWAGIERGLNFEELVKELTGAYAVPADEAATDAATFLADLAGEKLIVETSATGASATPTSTPLASYLPPKLEKFPDLQELLLIDPIHEVDERGWPHAKPE